MPRHDRTRSEGATDRQIEAAIEAAERRSAAEIAVAFLPRAERYRSTALLASMTMFAFFYMLAIWFDSGSLSVAAPGSGSWLAVPGWAGPAVALCSAIFFFLVCEHSALGVWLTPVIYRRQACRTRAKLLFLDHGIDATQDRLAVLICLCRAERQIDILADRGVAAVIPDERWNQLIAAFRQHKGGMELEQAVAKLVAAVADELAAHFPPWPGQINELPDRPLRS